MDDANKNVHMLAKLLGPIKAKRGITTVLIRKAVVESIRGLAEVLGVEYVKMAECLADLNAMSDKRVEEYDFNRLLPALNVLGGKEGWEAFGGEGKVILPLSFTLLHFLYDLDGVLSRGAFKGLKALTDYLSASPELVRVLETSVMPSVKFGLTCHTDAPRKLFIQLVRHCAITFGSGGSSPNDSPHVFGDLASLANDDEEVDFFRNVTHVQQHRRVRGFAKLRKLLDAGETQFCQQSLTGFLLPLSNHPIFEASKNTDEAFALEGVAMVGSIAGHLRYGAWISLVNLYLVQIPKHPENERYLIAALCSILGAFHEDLEGEGKNVEGVKRGLEKLMPKVEKLLMKETTKSGSKVKTLRASVVLALLALFQKASLMETKFSGLVLTVCQSLRAKESDSRDVARSVLAKIVLAVGVRIGLGEVVHQLAVSLGEGYQLHIRAAALHTILLAVSKDESIVSSIHDDGDFDECVPAIMDLIQEDVFGVAAEMKEVKDAEKRVIKEAVGVKSYDTLEILSSMIRFRPSDTTVETLAAVHAIVTPFVERLKSEEDASKLGVTIKKCRACLDRVVIGLSKNVDANGEEVLKFVWATIAVFLGGGAAKRKREEVEDEDEDLESSDEEDDGEREGIKITSKGGKMKAARKEKKGEGKKQAVTTWQPSLQEVHNSKSAREMMVRSNERSEANSQVNYSHTPHLPCPPFPLSPFPPFPPSPQSFWSRRRSIRSGTVSTRRG